MANAPRALTAAQRPIAAVAVSGKLAAGQLVQLKAAGSAAAGSHTISSFAWSNVAGPSLAIQNANTDTASVTLPSCGLSTLALTVTDDAGRQDTAQVVVGPTSVTTTAPAQAGPISCSTAPPAIQVEVCPASAAVQAKVGTQAFVASVANSADTNVIWEVNGIDGGNAQVGTISSTGVYSAPAKVPSVGIQVTAVSAADSSAQSSAQLTITSPPPKSGGGGLDWVTLLVAAAAACRGLRFTAAKHPRAS
jgi:hypothetical protein